MPTTRIINRKRGHCRHSGFPSNLPRIAPITWHSRRIFESSRPLKNQRNYLPILFTLSTKPRVSECKLWDSLPIPNIAPTIKEIPSLDACDPSRWGSEDKSGLNKSDLYDIPSNESCSLLSGKIISVKYKVGGVLGHGHFGQVYHVTDLENKQDYALKVPIQHELDNEIACLTAFMSAPPVIVDVGSNTGFLMELRGNSLEKYKTEYYQIHPAFACTVAIKILSDLQHLHHRGWIHRDIKPENILFGRNTDLDSGLYLVDMGLAQRYLDADGMHIPQIKVKANAGTRKFMSRNCHNKMSMSRKDDIESLAYTLLYLLNGNLPWANEELDMIIIEKEYLVYEDVCKGLPQVFEGFLKSARQLKHDEEPNYQAYHMAFEQEYNRIVKGSNAPFDPSPVIMNDDWS